MADQGMYVANRNVKILTNKGYCFLFEKDVPKYVPPLVREEMLQHGILPVEGELPIKEPAPRAAEPIGQQRIDLIYENVLAIIERNSSDDFTAGGVPREDAFLRQAGFPAARRELNQAFKKYLRENAPGG